MAAALAPSELVGVAEMRTAPEAPVVAWLDRQPAESVWITSITLFEARLGLALLPTGRRRQTLEAAFARLLKEDLENRVLDFDSAAATEAASIAAERQKAGRPVDMRDTQIAGIALARRATLATRNVRHFADLKVPIVNPWVAQDG
jgi:predicted nucleic acid-binding protein